jgi:hypothetical protein
MFTNIIILFRILCTFSCWVNKKLSYTILYLQTSMDLITLTDSVCLKRKNHFHTQDLCICSISTIGYSIRYISMIWLSLSAVDFAQNTMVVHFLY